MHTSWTSVKGFYGLKHPFRFEVAIPFLLNACTLAVLVLVCLVLFGDGDLNIGTERFFFFSYAIALLVLGATFSRVAIVSYPLFLWCIAELIIALTTSALESYGIGTSAFPVNVFTKASDPRFMYHPLLQIVLKPNLHWVEHADTRNRAEQEKTGSPINWQEVEGRDFVFSQNSLGLRGAEPTAEDLKKGLIFVYGGSTTYDVTVSQGETWVEQLQADLNDRYTVLNLGVPGYSTTEHLIQTAFYQDALGKRPQCAIYYIGWNDIHSAHIGGLDNAYADFHLPLRAVRVSDLYFAKYSPFVRLINEVAKRRFDSLPPPPFGYFGRKPVTGSDKYLEKIYVEHVDTIASINKSRGIKTVFIGQILNRNYFKQRPHDANWWAPLVRNEDMWPLQERFNLILERASVSSNIAKYIDAGIENFGINDFTDEGHFTAAGSKKFARLLAEKVQTGCE